MRDITAEAHRQGMQVWAHSMVFPARPLEVVTSGADVVSHVCRLAWEAMADAPARYDHGREPEFGLFTPESPVFTELFSAMRTNGTILDATLALYARHDSIRRAEPGRRTGEPCDVGFARGLVRTAHQQGVPIAAGTDFVNLGGEPWPELFTELEELVRHGGLSPMAAIEAGTRVAAEAMGIENEIGTLEHGRPVTFVLLADDPLEDIANLRSIRAVWKNATRFDRAAFRAPVAEVESNPDPPSPRRRAPPPPSRSSRTGWPSGGATI